MAYTPQPAGPRNIRELFHYLWNNLKEVGENIGGEGGAPLPGPVPDPGHQHWHDNLINVLPDQHHPQLHDVESHTDVATSGLKDHEVLCRSGATYINDRRTKVHGGETLPANNVSLPGDMWFNNGTGQPN